MLKIWGRTTSSNVQKALWCCAELGIEYERLDLGGPFGGMLIRAQPEQRDQAAIEAARLQALAAWTILEDELEHRPYLAGPELTLAEIALGIMVYRWHAFPIERPPLKNLKAWYERMRERPGFKAHIEIPIT